MGTGDMTEVERLGAIEEIKALQARRCRALDTKDWPLYRSCHTEDFQSFTLQSVLADYKNTGLDGAMEGIIRAMEGTQSIHVTTSAEITFSSPTEATAIWRLEDRIYWNEDGQEHWAHGFGFYHDGYAKPGGEWLFTSRRIERLRVDRSPGATRSRM